MTQAICLLGLGAMGSAMATRWLDAGYPLAVYNRSRAKTEAMAAKGARAAQTPHEAASGADIVISIVYDDDASRAIWFGAQGALESLKPGAIAIETSTLSPPYVRELGARAAAMSARFLDAPVGGGPREVLRGALAMFVGGDRDALQSARPALEVIASRIEHVGEIGAGATWKLINYMMAGAQLASLAEALTLAGKAGVAPARAAELIRQSVVASPAVIGKLSRMVERRFAEPDAALRLVAKDQRYAEDLARALGAEMEILPVVAAIFARAEREGFGDADLAAVIQSVDKHSKGPA
jgi:3-hydroxyisobutyrate dehydrogenase